MKIELCVDSLDSIKAAEDIPISRIELCSCLSEGGLTPTLGMLKLAKKMTKVPIFCMIRPRSGDFLYSDLEFECMRQDMVELKDLSDGFVFGILNSDGTIDKERVSQLVKLSKPKEVTFHRAFDMCKSLTSSLDDLIELGIERVLTSGGESTCIMGKATIMDLMARSLGKIIIMPGSGVTRETITQVQSFGVTEIHLTAKKVIKSQMLYKNNECNMGSDKIQTNRTILQEIFEKLK